ncbi:MAG: ferritin-like domain-containing protein [Alphaproteobacteria bacterium]|nr:ferritin-like domain-containing protein [Alphaproteobacteria bacterium]
MTGWTLDDIPWERFDRTRVDPDIVPLIKAACLVEYNADDYRRYLEDVFADDPKVRKAVEGWSREEVQHGLALGRWATLADPAFDFDRAFRAFTTRYKLPLGASESVRGSRTGEMIARCMVETGTSSYYTALADATREPVLKAICRNIAHDEIAHYWLFYNHMRRYLDSEHLGMWARVRVAFSRIAETEDDELASAYFAANGDGGQYDRAANFDAYRRVALRYYRPWHVERGAGMVFKAVGVPPETRSGRFLTRLVCMMFFLKFFLKTRRMISAAA